MHECLPQWDFPLAIRVAVHMPACVLSLFPSRPLVRGESCSAVPTSVTTTITSNNTSRRITINVIVVITIFLINGIHSTI
ncbi:hypothetical protein E2C01_002335 [Portunus trituberculatus]|uniref:Uncharacterized protein n=1 Tax=Portunus trituberculatus TaxID=210409 RepID=A0A5B7CKB0_PORTR|nr:hypothetical protein [Portunus trituberculatus]